MFPPIKSSQVLPSLHVLAARCLHHYRAPNSSQTRTTTRLIAKTLRPRVGKGLGQQATCETQLWENSTDWSATSARSSSCRLLGSQEQPFRVHPVAGNCAVDWIVVHYIQVSPEWSYSIWECQLDGRRDGIIVFSRVWQPTMTSDETLILWRSPKLLRGIATSDCS